MSKTKADKQHLSDVASLGCIACRNAGYGATPAEIHHVRFGSGMAQRAEHTRVLPLCPRHHRACYPTGFHAAPRAWQVEHGNEEALLEQVAREVTELRKNTIGRAA
ncbi:Ref family protein [Aeromonas rivipollensis]|uniref:Ref family recombination enhancement nuclease n=1 Tax=Aeromonas rivipollensis TaxID=948519 RepID=UPI00259F723E|nr:Ref family recombination enhancement nuclease [Aeromonas rivipollensis]MDM5083720.1 Ref family protein [Aeromonas rivipollensis]MDM5096098.1 Ref family protein [Aeromonas rivipollensis]MDM5104349.1 Ref family protein [Aeromonas rivipollensis]